MLAFLVGLMLMHVGLAWWAHRVDVSPGFHADAFGIGDGIDPATQPAIASAIGTDGRTAKRRPSWWMIDAVARGRLSFAILPVDAGPACRAHGLVVEPIPGAEACIAVFHPQDREAFLRLRDGLR